MAKLRWTMPRPPIVMPRLAAAAAVATFAAVGATLVGGWPMLVGLLLLALAIDAVRLRRGVRRALARLERLMPAAPPGELAQRLAACAAAMEASHDEVRRRLSHRHATSGLPTREPLVQRMSADGAGTLGLVACRDLDRLAAFDPALGERVLLVLVDRLTRMIGDRFVAHVDRAQLAVWFDAAVPVETAAAELRAIGYALGDRIDDGAREIVPEIGLLHASFPHDGATPQVLLSRALAALALGRSGVAQASATVAASADAARDRYLIEQDLRQAVARSEFAMCYQPLIDAEAGRVCGAEALLRWHRPRHGLVSPARFMPVVEMMGLADEVGLWTLNAACREARGWQADGLGGLRVAVNVSAHQLARSDMQVLVERTLARHGLPAAALEIELTESVAAADAARAAELFTVLRRLGVKIAIDDFGTGFSSFSALRTLSFDKIKIDREFVTAVDTRRDSQAICQSVIALGRGLGIRVLAEGVERPEEYRWLRRHGCRHFQGYYFAAPLAPADFVGFVRDRAGLARLLASDAVAGQHQLAQRLSA